MTPRSARTFAWTSGRCTLITTSRPSWSVARWTWASDAAPNGVCSIGREQRLRIRTQLVGDDRPARAPTGRAAPCSGACRARRAIPRGRASARLLAIWPSFTKVGPSCWSITRTLAGVRQLLELGVRPADHAVAQPPDRRERRAAHGDLQAVGRHRVVDLLEPDALDERVPASCGQALEESARSGRPAGASSRGRSSPRNALNTVSTAVNDDGIDEQPEQLRVRERSRVRQAGPRSCAHDPEQQSVHEHDGEADRSQDEPAEQRRTGRAGGARSRPRTGCLSRSDRPGSTATERRQATHLAQSSAVAPVTGAPARPPGQGR